MEHYVSAVGSASVFRYRRAPYMVEVTGHYKIRCSPKSEEERTAGNRNIVLN